MKHPKPRLSADAPEEQAVRWLIKTHTATISDAAARYDVRHNSIRSRIEYRYGSLSEARSNKPAAHEKDSTRTRPCIICKEPKKMDRQQYICKKCRVSLESVMGGL